MKNSIKSKSILGAIVLLFFRGNVNAVRNIDELIPTAYGVQQTLDEKSILCDGLFFKILAIPIAFLIGLCVVIFGKKLSRKSKIIICSTLGIIALVITMILCLM